jgi:cytoskeleton protein RodZ
MSSHEEPLEATPAVPTPEPELTPGEAIRRARQRSHIDVAELAKLTKLGEATIVALESDDFTTLNEPVYVRGYYRKCAKALGIPEAPLLAGYTARVKQVAPKPPSKLRLAGAEAETHGMSRGKLAVLGPIVAVVATVGLWWYFNSRSVSAPPWSSRTATVMVDTANKPEPAAAATASLAAASLPDAAETAVSSARPLSAANAGELSGPRPAEVPPPPPSHAATELPSAASSAATDAGSPSAAEAARDAGDTRLVLEFVETSWVKIEDSKGRVLLSRVVQKGEAQALDGVPPYNLFLGNAPGVRIRYQGQQIDTAAFVRSNSTARMSVPSS